MGVGAWRRGVCTESRTRYAWNKGERDGGCAREGRARREGGSAAAQRGAAGAAFGSDAEKLRFALPVLSAKKRKFALPPVVTEVVDWVTPPDGARPNRLPVELGLTDELTTMPSESGVPLALVNRTETSVEEPAGTVVCCAEALIRETGRPAEKPR